MSSDRDDPFRVIEQAASRQAAEERAARALAAARVRLVLGRHARSAFFATLVLRLAPEPAWDVETLSTDGKVLRYFPPFVTALSPDELVGVLAHEVMHCALAHPARRGGRDPERWNVACDLAVNPLLVAAGVVLPPSRLMPGNSPFSQCTSSPRRQGGHSPQVTSGCRMTLSPTATLRTASPTSTTVPAFSWPIT